MTNILSLSNQVVHWVPNLKNYDNCVILIIALFKQGSLFFWIDFWQNHCANGWKESQTQLAQLSTLNTILLFLLEIQCRRNKVSSLSVCFTPPAKVAKTNAVESLFFIAKQDHLPGWTTRFFLLTNQLVTTVCVLIWNPSKENMFWMFIDPN